MKVPQKKYQQLLLAVLVVVLLTQSYTIAQTSRFPQGGKRYLAWMLFNFDNKPEHSGLELINLAAQNGCNAVYLTVPWYVLYSNVNTKPDWTKIDNQINLCVKLGLKVALRIHVGQQFGQIKNGFWTEKECMIDQNDYQMRGIYDQTSFSFSHQPSIDKAKGFIREVCERYNNIQKQGNILWVAVTNTPVQELGYFFENWPNGDGNKGYEAIYDFSKESQLAFQNFVARKYGKIARLNARWKRDFESFDKTHPPTTLWSPRDGFSGDWGHDWYLFRHIQLKNFIEQTTSEIRRVNPDYKVIFETGAVTDDISGLRGSLAFKDLVSNLDGIKINDATEFDNRFTMDVVRGNIPLEKWIMNEAFCNVEIPLDGLEKQINHNFEHGAQLVTMVISTTEQFERVKDLMRRMSNKWLPKPMEYSPPAQSVSYTLSRALDVNFRGTGVYADWLKKGGVDNKIVDVRIIEDVLYDTLQGTLNRAPIVKNNIPNRSTYQGVFFSYKIAPEVFIDVDGIIARIEARGLPPGLSFKDNVIFGTPTELSTYQIILRATDDEGAAVETSFSLTVVPLPVGVTPTPTPTPTTVTPDPLRINKKPVLKKNLPDTIVFYKQPFRYEIPEDTFFDPDGFIGRIEIVNQPSWLQIKSAEFYGTAAEVGTFTIKVIAYDDDEASVQTSFKITVKYPEIKLELVGGGGPVKRVRIQSVSDDDIISAKDLPNLINIYVNCEAIFNKVDMTLTGPQNITKSVNTVPFALFQGSEGFVPLAGNYTLKTSVYQNKELITERTTKFRIASIDPITKKPILIDDWVAYPNPTDNYFVVKIPNSEDVSKLRFSFVAMSGQTVPIPDNTISFSDNTAYISLQPLQLAAGSQLLKIEKEGTLLRIIRMTKF